MRKAEQMGMTPEQMRRFQDQMQQGRNGAQKSGEPNGMSGGKNKNQRSDDKPGRRNRLKKGIDALLEGGDAEWFKNLSRLDPGEIEDALQSVPSEYRALVREYFSELSKEARK